MLFTHLIVTVIQRPFFVHFIAPLHFNLRALLPNLLKKVLLQGSIVILSPKVVKLDCIAHFYVLSLLVKIVQLIDAIVLLGLSHGKVSMLALLILADDLVLASHTSLKSLEVFVLILHKR